MSTSRIVTFEFVMDAGPRSDGTLDIGRRALPGELRAVAGVPFRYNVEIEIVDLRKAGGLLVLEWLKPGGEPASGRRVIVLPRGDEPLGYLSLLEGGEFVPPATGRYALELRLAQESHLLPLEVAPNGAG
jgi:hypothetical protein